jgi:hypothetical protein
MSGAYVDHTGTVQYELQLHSTPHLHANATFTISRPHPCTCINYRLGVKCLSHAHGFK